MKPDYELLDSGRGLKFERFGPYSLIRPAAQAPWQPQLSQQAWDKADAIFTREGGNQWLKAMEHTWQLSIAGLTFSLSNTDFGHLGIFPEQQPCWEWIAAHTKRDLRILNLFAYSGGSTLAAAKAGAELVHLDASKGMVSWARKNAILNKLAAAPIRWIVDDALKFLKKELKRGKQYDAIILDPPSFGRGPQGEVFKIDTHILPLLSLCQKLMSSRPHYLLFTCHTPGYTPTVMRNLLSQFVEGGQIEAAEMYLSGAPHILPLPNGSFARWSAP